MNASLRSGFTLGLCVFIALCGLTLAHHLTADRIKASQRALLLHSLEAVLPEQPFDNDPLQSVQWITAEALGSKEPLAVYSIYQYKKPYAAILSVVAPNGYNGEIRLLVGLGFEGNILGVRATEHSETPGLGDDIDRNKSAWIENFTGQSLENSRSSDWAVKKRSGKYDAFTGATITPQAVITAVHRALEWYAQNRQQIFPP